MVSPRARSKAQYRNRNLNVKAATRTPTVENESQTRGNTLHSSSKRVKYEAKGSSQSEGKTEAKRLGPNDVKYKIRKL